MSEKTDTPSQSQPCGVGPLDHTGQQAVETSGKHTPGPWASSWVEVRGSLVEPFSGFLVWPAHQTSIAALMGMTAITSPWAYGEDDEIGEANARLIAAAPEMLSALREVADWMSYEAPETPDEWKLLRAVKAAIDKASAQ